MVMADGSAVGHCGANNPAAPIVSRMVLKVARSTPCPLVAAELAHAAAVVPRDSGRSFHSTAGSQAPISRRGRTMTPARAAHRVHPSVCERPDSKMSRAQAASNATLAARGGADPRSWLASLGPLCR
jgi:hypothetical protein